MPTDSTLPDTPLRQLRRILAPMLGSDRPVPMLRMAALLGIHERTWRAAERDGRDLSRRTMLRVLAATQSLGVPLRPDHFFGYEAMPELPRTIASPEEAAANIARLIVGAQRLKQSTLVAAPHWPTPQDNATPLYPEQREAPSSAIKGDPRGAMDSPHATPLKDDRDRATTPEGTQVFSHDSEETC